MSHCSKISLWSVVFSTLMINLLASIYEPSMLLYHLVLCTIPPVSSDLLALPQWTSEQQGMESCSVFNKVVCNWQSSFLMTFFSPSTWQSMLASQPCPPRLLHLQSRLHAWNSTLHNVVSLRYYFPLQCNLVNLQAHLNTVTSSDITSYIVNSIPALRWLVVSIHILC